MTSDGVCADVCDGIYVRHSTFLPLCVELCLLVQQFVMSALLAPPTVRSHVKHETGVSETDGVILAHLLDMIWRILMF